MSRRIVLALLTSVLAGWTTGASAWWDEGHMKVAALAWELLTPAAKAEASRLIRKNPEYNA